MKTYKKYLWLFQALVVWYLCCTLAMWDFNPFRLSDTFDRLYMLKGLLVIVVLFKVFTYLKRK